MREKNARNNQTRKKQEKTKKKLKEKTQRKNPENNKPKPNANPTNEHSIKNERLELPRIRKTTPKTTQKRPLKGLLKGPNLPYNPTNFPQTTTRTNDQPGKKTKKSREGRGGGSEPKREPRAAGARRCSLESFLPMENNKTKQNNRGKSPRGIPSP